ncbi:hypothetical protein UCMB321_2318 [Pseudomonas batumici]|uniref:Uncharacterized protein n=1 Tax=Pseudomonas batumici TaxID=226910 RepID=A0A0C2I3V9_9PSED|nr:hypothetical protein UCMB321_2318 [Pseudomonas batumici]
MSYMRLCPVRCTSARGCPCWRGTCDMAKCRTLPIGKSFMGYRPWRSYDEH